MSKKITTIQIHKDTLEGLKKLKIINRETYDSIIKRLIFLPKSIVKINEIVNGIMQPISHDNYKEFEKEIRGDLVKILTLILSLYDNRILKEYRGEYFSIEDLKNEIEKGRD